MNIIRATESHLEQLIPLFNGYRIFYKQPADLEGARHFLMNRLDRKESVIFLAIDDENQGMGFTQLYPSFSSVSMQHTYILNDLFVSEKARRVGIAEALLLRAQQFAAQNDCKGLTLETAVDNPAQNLYKRMGWVLDSEVNHYTWKA